MKANHIKIDGIKELLNSNLSIFYMDISNDESKHSNHRTYDGGMHLKALIVTDNFIDMSLINRHKLVYKILNHYLKNGIHALSMRTLTKEEYLEKTTQV